MAINDGNMDAPVMEVLIDSENARILNSDQVVTQISNQNTVKGGNKIKALGQSKKPDKKKRNATAKSHGSKCKCCICKGLKKGKKQLTGTQFAMNPRKLGTCVCGSILCKKDWEKLKTEERHQKIEQNLRQKKCLCGSNICDEESQKQPEVLLEAAKQVDRAKEKASLAKAKEKIYQVERKKRAKERQIAFKKLLKERNKEDKRKMRSIQKQTNSGTISMIAESWLDLGSFGSKAFCDIAGSLFHSVRYPRDTINDVRDAIRKPGTTAKTIRKSVAGMGLYSTLDRIKQRFFKTPTAKVAISTMESYPATNYLIHMADTDPKKRMKKFKPKRKREQIEFKCSLYMSSMRKRPCLTVYHMCPWFYPHCISLLTIWKQFTDILLFILAVGVWSPCIMCMELLRGCVCCCMCQG